MKTLYPVLLAVSLFSTFSALANNAATTEAKLREMLLNDAQGMPGPFQNCADFAGNYDDDGNLFTITQTACSEISGIFDDGFSGSHPKNHVSGNTFCLAGETQEEEWVACELTVLNETGLTVFNREETLDGEVHMWAKTVYTLDKTTGNINYEMTGTGFPAGYPETATFVRVK